MTLLLTVAVTAHYYLVFHSKAFCFNAAHMTAYVEPSPKGTPFQQKIYEGKLDSIFHHRSAWKLGNRSMDWNLILTHP
jgi:hypothetical protein